MACRDRFGGTAASSGDDTAASAGAAAGAEPGTGPGEEPEQGEELEVYGDSAYGSGEARAAYRDAGHDTVIKPKPLQPAVPGGFTLDDFTISEDQGTVTCPAGVTRPMSPARTVTFGAACAGCSLRQRCTTARDGRSMTIHPHEGLLRAARAQARTPEFKRAYPTRSMIERVISWTATQNGRRVKLRYTGTARNDAWLHNRCAAINLRTLLRHGLTRSGAGPGRWPDRPGTRCPLPRPRLLHGLRSLVRASAKDRRGRWWGIPVARAGSADHRAMRRIRVVQRRPRAVGGAPASRGPRGSSRPGQTAWSDRRRHRSGARASYRLPAPAR